MRPLIMKLATKISVEAKSYTGITVNDPEYRILEPVVTDEMAEVALAAKVRKNMTAQEIAKRCKKPLEETKKLLWDLAVAGVMRVHSENGTDYYMLPIWVPGIMEMMVANKEQAEKYPVMAECFEEYTRRRTRLLGPNVPVGESCRQLRGSIYLYRECVEAVRVRLYVPPFPPPYGRGMRASGKGYVHPAG